MARIQLDWHEAQNGDLPMVCATCGARATDMVENKLSTVRPGLLSIVRTRATVLLPYCPRHRVASWNGFMRVVAKSITDDGITLGQVADEFVDAVWDYRERPEKYRGGGRGQRAAESDEDEDTDDESPRRRRSGSGEGARLFFGIAVTGLVILGVSCFGGGLFLWNFLGPGAARQTNRPGFNQPVGPEKPRLPFRR